MRVSYLAVAAAALMLGGTAAPAFAADLFIPGTGYSSSAGSNTGTDAFGNGWSWGNTSSGASVWGTPGLGAGTVPYGSATAATDFAVTFIGSPVPTIDQTPSTGPGGFNEFTRFDSVEGGTVYEWNPVFTGPNTVTFYAPTGVSLAQGDQYFVNIIFSDSFPTGLNTGFTAQFSVENGAPGPVPGAGLAGLAALALAGLYTRARRA